MPLITYQGVTPSIPCFSLSSSGYIKLTSIAGGDFVLQLKVNSMIEFNPEELPGFLVQKIKKDLTLPNPQYVNAKRLGFWTGGLDREIFLYRHKEGRLILPRGYGPELVTLFKKHGIAYQMDDQRLLLPEVSFNSRIRLRGYQVPAVEKLVLQRQGGLVSPPGSGKTEMMLAVIAAIKQPALWISHTSELLCQAKGRAAKAFNMNPDEVGVIADGKVTTGKRLTVALIQTLHKSDLREIVGRFGCVVVDEGHHAAARTFYDTINRFPALYRYWCSATPERLDGLTRMVFAAGGPILHEIDLQDLPIVIPDLQVIETEYSGHSENYAELITDLIQNKRRNRLIVDTVVRETPGNYSLVLSDRIEHLHTLAAMLKEAAPDLRVETLTGKGMTKRARAAVMEQAQNREIDVLLATQLAREGLDLPHLNRLFLCTPKRAAGATQQEIGRVMRPCEGKQDAIVFDFVDFNSPVLRAQYWRRQDVYRRLGMDIKRKACKGQALAGVS